MFNHENFQPAVANEKHVQPSTAQQESYESMAKMMASKQQGNAGDIHVMTNGTLDLSHNSSLFDSVHNSAKTSEYHSTGLKLEPEHKIPSDESHNQGGSHWAEDLINKLAGKHKGQTLEESLQNLLLTAELNQGKSADNWSTLDLDKAKNEFDKSHNFKPLDGKQAEQVVEEIKQQMAYQHLIEQLTKGSQDAGQFDKSHNFKPLDGKQAEQVVEEIKQQMALQHLIEQLTKGPHDPSQFVERGANHHGHDSNHHGHDGHSGKHDGGKEDQKHDWVSGCDKVASEIAKGMAEIGANMHFPDKALTRMWTDINQDMMDVCHWIKDFVKSGGKTGLEDLGKIITKLGTDVAKFCQKSPNEKLNELLYQLPQMLPKLAEMAMGHLGKNEIADFVKEIHETTHKIAETQRHNRDLGPSVSPLKNILPNFELVQYDDKRVLAS